MMGVFCRRKLFMGVAVVLRHRPFGVFTQFPA